MARNAVLAVVLVMICGLAFLTLSVAAEDGIDILVVISFIVLVLLGVGAVGALTAPPEDR